MNTKILGIFLSGFFILHNIEEYRSFKDFKAFYLKKINEKLRHRKVFLYALILLTFFVSGICISNYLIASQTLQFATTLIAVSLFINGMQHCIFSVWTRKILPGTISAIFLLIPCSAIYLVFLEKEMPFGLIDIATWSIVSAILMLLAIHASLWIGYLFLKKPKNHHTS